MMLGAALDAIRRRLDLAHGEQGYVAVFVALCLPLLIGMCALGVDVANWHFRGAQIQKAADSAALAGVVYLPGSPDAAKDAAEQIACLNLQPWNTKTAGGQCALPAGVSFDATPVPGRPTRLRVTITAPVDNAFGAIFGQTESQITRTVVSDFAGPVPMGSPCNSFGNTPGTPWGAASLSTCPSPDLWLQIAGPEATKVNGDRYAAAKCDTSGGTATGGVFRCDAANGPNDEYTEDGYFYVVRVRQAGQVTLQAYDPAFVETGQYCDANLNADWAGAVTGINSFIPGTPTATRAGYAKRLYSNQDDAISGSTLVGGKASGEAGPYCAGDSYAVGSSVKPTVTSFVMRGPYAQGDPKETPVLTGCGGGSVQGEDAAGAGWVQFSGRDSDNGYSNLRSRLTQAITTGANKYDPKLAGVFRQWVPLCTFNAGVGDYLIQIRTNVPLGTDPTDADAGTTTGGGGQNMMGLRALQGGGASTNLSVFGLGRMSIWANAASTTRQFYLARATSGVAGKTLRLQLYDIGDAQGNGSLTILPPPDANVGARFSNCVGTVSAKIAGDWAEKADPASRSDCSTTSTPNGSTATATNYNGKVLTFRVPIPKTYRCNDVDPNGCWIKIQYTFPQPPHDVTTWSASIDGDPVRIVE